MSKFVLICLCIVALSACGGDPVIGTWLDSTVSTGLTAYSETYVFKADKTFTINVSFTIDASADTQPGCTITDTFSGTWTDNATGTLNTTVTAGTESASGCTSSADDLPEQPADSETLTGVSHASTYSIVGNQMTLTNSAGTATFVKQ